MCEMCVRCLRTSEFRLYFCVAVVAVALHPFPLPFGGTALDTITDVDGGQSGDNTPNGMPELMKHIAGLSGTGLAASAIHSVVKT